MSIFKALAKIVTLPIRVVAEAVDDVKNDNGEGAGIAAILTLGASSAVKAVAKTAQEVVEEVAE